MTTIATDGRTMAGDDQVTGGGQVLASRTKIIGLPDGRVFGCTGYSDECSLFAKWMQGGIEKPTLGDDFAALVLTPDNKAFWIGQRLEPVEWSVPATIGSGGDIALGAMLAGKSPAEAVQIAASRDVGTGSVVTVMEAGK